jgi:hypothetical protein
MLYDKGHLGFLSNGRHATLGMSHISVIEAQPRIKSETRTLNMCLECVL